MHVFLDFEASSLAKKSYPIEVAWIFEDGRSESHLIRPAPDWTDWDEDAARIHGLDRATLEGEGTPHEVVARRVVDQLASHDVHASAPSWDGKWMSLLLRAAGLPRHAVRLTDTEDAQAAAVREALSLSGLGGPAIEAAVTRILAQQRETAKCEKPAHRALADATRERALWIEAGRLARALLPDGAAD